MLDVTWTVTLRLQGPVLTRSSTPWLPGIDAPAARSGDKLLLPGTLVQGALRHAWAEVARAAPGAFADPGPSLLGGGVERDGVIQQGGVPQRGRLRIGDFLADDRSGGRLTRIEIDDELGSVRSGHLRVAEAPFLPGEEAVFVGKVELFAADGKDADEALFQLRAGLGWIAAYGSEKTVGFGRSLGFDVAEERKVVAAELSVPTGGGAKALPLCLTFDEPVCFPAVQPVDNLFESTDEIPGGTLKGALATTLNLLAGLPPGAPVGANVAQKLPRWKDLAVSLSVVRFTNAFSAPARAVGSAPPRPVRPPLSLVKWRDATQAERLSDAWRAEGPFVLGGQAPAFAPDWKDDSGVGEAFGWSRPKRELRVHTAIDAKTGTVAEGQLFALEMLRPEGTTWRGSVVLDGVPADQRSAVAAQLRDLLETVGLRRVGKTDARAKVVIPATDPGDAINSGSPAEGGPFIVTLQTDALLGDPTALPESAGAAELRAFYEAAWKQLSGGSLRLVRFFARQRLLGGKYLWKRFRPGTPYAPWLLTAAGSVFVLEASGDAKAARKKLDAWRAGGLPVPPGLAGGEPAWKTCPFVPENGWGEIAVNLSTHEERDATRDASFLDVGFPAVWKAAGGPVGGAA